MRTSRVGVERRVHPHMARVTVERRLLGLIPISKTTLPNVVGVGSVHGSPAQSPGARPQIDAVLTLRLADGRIWNGPPAYAPFGTPPWKMASGQITQFIDDPSLPSLSFWCVSWMLHLAAVPFLLVGIFSTYFGVRSLIRLTDWPGRGGCDELDQTIVLELAGC